MSSNSPWPARARHAKPPRLKPSLVLVAGTLHDLGFYGTPVLDPRHANSAIFRHASGDTLAVHIHAAAVIIRLRHREAIPLAPGTLDILNAGDTSGAFLLEEGLLAYRDRIDCPVFDRLDFALFLARAQATLAAAIADLRPKI